MSALNAFLVTLAALAPGEPNRHVYPLAPALASPIISTDIAEFPAGKAWSIEARDLASRWFGTITSLLATDGRDPLTGKPKGKPYIAPKVITLIFKPKIDPPAYASGTAITINGEWITSNPGDLGMVIHELTHVIQAYPRNEHNTGWLVEGIADYIRWWRYEPELHAGRGRTKIDPQKSSYTDGYRTTAMWLAWIGKRYHMAIVPCLDRVLRDAEDPMPEFKRVTGKTADELWTEFVGEQA